MYCYIESREEDEESWAVVGFYTPNGTWIKESEWADPGEAARRVNYLNGGSGAPIAGGE